jgi:hypothetical protein
MQIQRKRESRRIMIKNYAEARPEVSTEDNLTVVQLDVG